MGQSDEYLHKQYFECECDDFDHTLRMMYFRDEFDYIYLSIHLRQKSFARRLWHAVKYVFGFRSRYGDFDEFLWSPKEATRFRDMLNQYLKDAEKSNENIEPVVE
jgi:hypothetical protein